MSEQKQEAKPKRPTSVRLKDSVPFGGREETTIIVTHGKCDRIFAARMEADGSAVAIDKAQRSDGLVFERDFTPAGSKEQRVERIFQAWANIRCVVY